jgi:hypothetical protein
MSASDAEQVAGGEPPQRRAVIFESYGRGDATDAAEKIKLSLRENGYEVWIDRDHLAPDERDFWQPIETALKGSHVVVALLSPHSRRLEGDMSANPRMSVCHNELISAVQMDKTVVCVTVTECKPPLALIQYDPIPFTNWSSSPEAYSDGLKEILHWIHEGLSGPTPRRRYSSYVDNLSQDKLTFPEEMTASDTFVGREWLIRGKLENWLKSNSRCFMIEAETGTGKTALVAELVRRNQGDRILAYHFCNSQNEDTVKPERFVRSIAAMLCGTIPAYRERLKTSNLVTALKRDNHPRTMLWQGVLEPLHDMNPGSPGYIIVDGLDEAAGAPLALTIPRLLSQALADFPSWLKLVITTRRDDRVPRFLSADHYVLSGAGAEQKEDLRQYIERRFSEPALRSRCDNEAELPRIIDALVERSLGNFQYATTVLDELIAGRLRPDQVGSLPASLADLYDDRAYARFPEGSDFETARIILGILLAARQPLSRTQLSQITGFDRPTILRQTLDQLSMFLTWEDGTSDRYYRVAHKSIADWLVDPPGGSDRFRVDPAKGRSLMLAHCRDWQTHHETYALTYLIDHLLIPDDLSGALEEALAIVRGGFFQARRQFGISASQDLNDTRTLVLALVARHDDGAILELSKTGNVWQRDGVAAGLQAAPKAADEFVHSTVGDLLLVT